MLNTLHYLYIQLWRDMVMMRAIVCILNVGHFEHTCYGSTVNINIHPIVISNME